MVADDARMMGQDKPLEPGIYEPLVFPYYCTNYFDAWFWNRAIRRIGDLPDGGIDITDAQCAYICSDCESRIRMARTLSTAYERVMT